MSNGNSILFEKKKKKRKERNRIDGWMRCWRNARNRRKKRKRFRFLAAREPAKRKQTKALRRGVRGVALVPMLARTRYIGYVYAKVLSKRSLSHRPFPEDIGIYSIILIRGSYRGFCFLAAQWPDSLHATVRVFPETGIGRWKERVAGARNRDGEAAATKERERKKVARGSERASWHVIPVTVIVVRYYSTANVIHLWFNGRSLDRSP